MMRKKPKISQKNRRERKVFSEGRREKNTDYLESAIAVVLACNQIDVGGNANIGSKVFPFITLSKFPKIHP
jgi:hypothetical protein